MKSPLSRRHVRLALAATAGLAGMAGVALGVLPQQEGTVDLLTQANVTLSGAAAGDASGFAVASAGDVNGDGRGDVVVGAWGADPLGRTDAGSSYVIYSQTAPADVDLASLGSAGFRIDGRAAGDNSGYTVASAGDVNGDGRGDVIVGAPWADPGAPARNLAGSSYVIYGQTSPVDIDLASLGSGGFRIDGAAAGDQSGTSVASAGDVNGDGLAEVIVGAPNASPRSRSGAGSTYVIYGRPSPSDVDLGSFGSRGARIDGAVGGDHSGYSVASAGDVNGDGRPDLIVGAPDASPSSRTGAGSSYVIYGQPNQTSIDLGSTSFPLVGFRIDGADVQGSSGRSVASAGDMNGDGRADVIVGAPTATPSSRNLAGSSYVIYGQAVQMFVDLAAPLGRGGFQIDGAAAGDMSGMSVASAGDVNGDGRTDVIVGAFGASPLSRTAAGSSYVIYGNLAQASVDLSVPLGSGGLLVAGGAAGDWSGRSVASAGDMNGDGRGDLIVGARAAAPLSRSNAGSSYVIYGFGNASVSYPAIAATMHAPMAMIMPTVRRTGTATFSVTPALPSGLTLDTATGVISGTPTQTSSGGYAITMTDLSGAATTTVSVTVNAAPVLPAFLRARMSCRGAVCSSSGPVPTGATRIVQSGRAKGKKAARGTCRITISGKGKKAKRTFTCTLRVTRGTWTITTAARAKNGTIVAQSVVTKRVK